MGDFNAKIGKDNTEYERIVERHGLGVMNENRETFADFFQTSNVSSGALCSPTKKHTRQQEFLQKASLKTNRSHYSVFQENSGDRFLT